MNERYISDVQLDAFLVADGYAILAIVGQPHRRVFVFDAPEEAVLRYYREDCLANPRRLFNAYRDVWSLLTQSIS
jgi:hypothetical protein